MSGKSSIGLTIVKEPNKIQRLLDKMGIMKFDNDKHYFHISLSDLGDKPKCFRNKEPTIRITDIGFNNELSHLFE